MGLVNLSYQPRGAFLPFHNRKARWSTLICHRRAGKTVALVNDLLIGSLECKLPNPQLAYIAPNYQQAKRVAWEYLKHYSGPLIEQTHESELRVTLKNSAKIFLLGAEKADSLRGMYLDGCVLDEYASMRPASWHQVIRPALSDRNGWAVFSGTPMGKNHLYDTYRASRDNPEWFTMMLKASESGIIEPDELEALRRQMDPADFAQEFECSFDAALRGAIYGQDMELAEREGRIADFDLDPNLPTDVICDLGYTDDTVLTFFQLHRDGPVIHEVYSNNELEWDSYLDEMDSRNVRTVYLPHDAKAKNLQTGRSIVEQTIRRGYRPMLVPDHKLRDGIAATRKILPFTRWNKSLTSGAVEAMKSYRREWDDKLGCYRDRPVHDWTSHVADCIRYLGVIFQNLPIVKSRLILPESVTREANYGFNLDMLFTDARVNPGIAREQ